MRQWQGYVKNASAHAGTYEHYLGKRETSCSPPSPPLFPPRSLAELLRAGMFFGMGSATQLPNVTFTECRAHCDALNTSCGGFTFVSDDPKPTVGSHAIVTAAIRSSSRARAFGGWQLSRIS